MPRRSEIVKRTPSTAAELLESLRAYRQELMSRWPGWPRDGAALMSHTVPMAVRLNTELGRRREDDADAHFQNGGWTVARCGDEHPLAWCAWNAAEEVADLRQYAVEFPSRTEHPPERQAALVRVCTAIELRLAEVSVLLAELDELGR